MNKAERVSVARDRLKAILAARKGAQDGRQKSTDGDDSNTILDAAKQQTPRKSNLPQNSPKSPRSTAPKVSDSPNAASAPIPPVSEVRITPNTPLSQKLEELQVALEAQLPELPYILKTIHTTLSQSPDAVPVLSDDEIGLIVQGLIQHTNTSIVPAPKKGRSKKSQPISLDMLD